MAPVWSSSTRDLEMPGLNSSMCWTTWLGKRRRLTSKRLVWICKVIVVKHDIEACSKRLGHTHYHGAYALNKKHDSESLAISKLGVTVHVVLMLH